MNLQTVLLLGAIPEGRVFGLDMQTLTQVGIQLLNLGLLAFILSRFLYNPVRDFMHTRTISIREQMKRAEDEIAEANELKLEYEQRLTELERERSDVLESARLLAAERSEQLLAQTQLEADELRARALLDIAAEQARVRIEMKQAIIEVSTAMAEKFVALAMDESAQDRLFDETMAELEEASWLK